MDSVNRPEMFMVMMISVFVIGVQAMQQSYNKRIDKGVGCTSKVYLISKKTPSKKGSV